MYHVRYVCTLRSALYVYAGKTFDVRSRAVYDILCIMARLRNNRIVFVFFFLFFFITFQRALELLAAELHLYNDEFPFHALRVSSHNDHSRMLFVWA